MNVPTRDTVTILTHSYLDGYTQNLSRPFGGGLERYVHALCRVIIRMGLQPVVYQLSYFGAFDTTYNGVRVRGWTYELDNIAVAFETMAESAEGLLLYGSCIWHPIRYRPGSIGICHGISWDRHDMPRDTKQEVAGIINEAVGQLELIVSVDSQFLTYCRSVCYFPDPARIALLPNAVDTEWFTPIAGANAGAGSVPLRVLFPRRLSFERGIVPMMLLATTILREYPDVIVEFAGELVEKTPIAIAFRLWLDSHPHQNRIEQRVYSFEEVRTAYQNADIVVIPTIFSEGTSLACLEAMSCGVPVVSSNVGGLNDIIVDGLNGLLVPPQSAALTAAVRTLLDNEALRSSMGHLARLTALAFDQRKWDSQWMSIIEAQRKKLLRS
ncbi:glycosyltransferase family 4 protein [Paenibacillus sinopodophylli]|uniref:glycosyltransferase family 4 protein n=1 Tax=Paenibacillus sinopodophylli TaxID=1837342 RepID=UPI00110D204F|nr:glycosyltransferase family 4 protein [Paenibacillus sinopodophylli]